MGIDEEDVGVRLVIIPEATVVPPASLASGCTITSNSSFGGRR